jgi:hypothetical protein
VYKPKIGEEEVEKMDVDPERTTSQDIIQIRTMDVAVDKDKKRPTVLNDQVETSLKRDLLLPMTMRPVEVVPTPNTFCRDGVLSG